MVNSMVERATSNMLIGPDWAMNIEICDICNHDPAKAKDVVKGIKKRLGSKNPKVQILALTLLETLVKNCGDFVHMHVAERDVLHEMVKIVKKKPDFNVKEKILILIDTWQEAFGGARARYPQYYAAYHELLRMGAVFPRRSDKVPVFTPPQTQPLKSYSNNTENGNEAAQSSAEAEYPTLSLTEIQNARGIMDVLAEMLTAIDPEKKEGLGQEVVVDLVEQCRTYKQRVVHLVNSTSDESLLCQGLALNDELQRVLAKHEALLSGASISSEKSKPETSQALVPVDAPLIDTGDSKQLGSTSGASVEVTPVTPNVQPATPANVSPKFDLLSGDDFSSPTAENSLAIVPVGEPQPASPPVSQHNALALVGMFSQNNNLQNVQTGQTYSPVSPQQASFNPNGVPPQYEPQSPYGQGSTPTWNGHMPQPPSPVYGSQTSGGGLPPPPWEAPPTDGATQYSQVNNNNPAMGMYMPHHQPMTGGHLAPHPHQQFQSGQPMMAAGGMLPQQQIQQGQMGGYMYYPQQMYPNQIGQPYGYAVAAAAASGYGYGGGYGGQGQQFLDQRMGRLSVGDETVYGGPSMANASYVHVPSGKPSKPEDKLFGDLVDFSKVKPNKTSPGSI